MNASSMNGIELSERVRAEAAVWVARLHSADRTAQVEAGLRQWLSEGEERRAAFELLTTTWERSARLRRRPLERLASWELPGFRVGFSSAVLAAAAIAAVATLGILFYGHRTGIATGVGEQRALTLEDGTRVYLNTDTQLAEHYDERTRRVELKKGEALFDVARRTDRPFIVVAGDREIRALGTQFVVRRDVDDLAVTLVEGQVRVTSASPAADPGPSLAQGPDAPQPPAITLSPGQRLTLRLHEAPKVDAPALEKVTAWQRGQVILDNTTLADAVAEMNRYSTQRLAVEDPASAAIRVSGRFTAGDQEDFAHAIAKAYGLTVRNDPQGFTIVGRPD